MVLEGAVLLRVQHLQQCAGGVSLVISRQLVDLVQQNDRVAALGRGDGADNTPRHGADVGAAVAADLRLVMDTAQTHAGKFTAHALRHRMGDGGLAHTRRADQTDDLPLHILVQLAHRQQLQNPFLDLLQTIMIPVQHLAGMGLIQIILRGCVPGQRQTGVQIAADDAAFRGGALHPGQTVTFL